MRADKRVMQGAIYEPVRSHHVPNPHVRVLRAVSCDGNHPLAGEVIVIFESLNSLEHDACLLRDFLARYQYVPNARATEASLDADSRSARPTAACCLTAQRMDASTCPICQRELSGLSPTTTLTSREYALTTSDHTHVVSALHASARVHEDLVKHGLDAEDGRHRKTADERRALASRLQRDFEAML